MEEIFGLKVFAPIAIGAEAEIYLVDFYGQKAVIKYRRPKLYRDKLLDMKIRSERTILEAKLTAKASLLGVNTPAIYAVSQVNTSILMEYIHGTTLSATNDQTFLDHLSEVASLLATMHRNGIIHGDPTPSNIVLSDNNTVFFIDFGLGSFSYDVEQMAVDANLFLKLCQSLRQNIYRDILSIFRSSYIEALGRVQGQKVFERISQIRMRGRYIIERREKS